MKTLFAAFALTTLFSLSSFAAGPKISHCPTVYAEALATYNTTSAAALAEFKDIVDGINHSSDSEYLEIKTRHEEAIEAARVKFEAAKEAAEGDDSANDLNRAVNEYNAAVGAANAKMEEGINLLGADSRAAYDMHKAEFDETLRVALATYNASVANCKN